MPQSDNILPLIKDIMDATAKLFPNTPIRVWYINLGKDSWKCIVIRTDNKIKLLNGVIRTSKISALQIVKMQLENIVGRSKKSL
jgi:hypothetical protein